MLARKTAFATPPSSVPTSHQSTSQQSAVHDAVERLLIKLNRLKFGSGGDKSVTLQAAREALKVFQIMLEYDPPRAVSRIIRRMYHICQQYFSRAPAFRVVLANVTRMAIKAVREASANARSIGGGADDDADNDAAGDLSMLDQAGSMPSMSAEAVDEVEEEEDRSGREESPMSPRGMAQRSASFSAFGHFPRQDTTEPEPDAAEEDTPQASNMSFGVPPTPATEATIARIPSHYAFTPSKRRVDYKDFRNNALSKLHELQEALEQMMDGLCRHAPDHIADGDVVLTYGSSYTQIKFFSMAADEGKRFTLLVLAAEPHGNTAALVSTLTAKGVAVQVLPDSECFNALSRVSKVFLSTDSVLANGGLLAPTGSLMVCICAKVFSVDVVVLCNTIKISPYYPSDSECTSIVKMSINTAKEMLWTTFSQPAKVLPPEHVHPVEAANGSESPLVFNPVLEYVAPEYVSLFVTDDGEFTTSYMHRFLKDAYDAEDTHL